MDILKLRFWKLVLYYALMCMGSVVVTLYLNRNYETDFGELYFVAVYYFFLYSNERMKN